ALLDLPGDPAGFLPGELGVVERAPFVYQPARRGELEDIALAPLRPVRTVAGVPLRRVLDVPAVEVLHGVLGFGDRVPDLLRARLDEYLIQLRGRHSCC